MMRQTMQYAMRRAQRGMSLIEVLVAIAIGMIGILIMTQAYLTSDEFNKATLGAGGAQTNGNVALFSLEREARMAGYGFNSAAALECGNLNWYYNGNYSGNLGGSLPNIELAPVVITSTAGAPDQITIMYATGEQRVTPGTLSKSMPSASSELNVDGTSGFQQNDMVLLVSKTAPVTCTMVQLTEIQTSASKLQHNPGGSAPYNPPGAGLFPAYAKNDSLFNLGNPIIRSYAIVNESLRVSEVFLNAATPGSGDFDLVDGIVDMRALYGKDTNDDGVVDVYNNVKPVGGAAWLQVLSLRIAVVARVGHYEKPTGANCAATTANPTWTYENPVGTPQTATFNWTDLTDVTNQARCYRYRVFETTVPVRNMIWSYS
jgi:type IV pilus assembly protein PilW